ncbi:6,7-dimethyl-8-ribityllumazine synthase [Burkholderia ubonensis]|nr:6,7-dimethyl-8-ribityllumazine synthase [Burkholderia ubonensis]
MAVRCAPVERFVAARARCAGTTTHADATVRLERTLQRFRVRYGIAPPARVRRIPIIAAKCGERRTDIAGAAADPRTDAHLLQEDNPVPQIAFVYGSYHPELVARMLEAARDEAAASGCTIVDERAVPGAMEQPLAVKRLLMEDGIDAVVALGIIEKGETSHGLVMAQAVIRSLIDLQLAAMKPVGVGILGPDILPDQIPPRLEPYARDAVRAARTMLADAAARASRPV